MAQVKENGDFDRDHDTDIGRPDASVRVAVLTADGLRVSADTPAGLPDRAVLDEMLRDGRTDRRTVQVVSGRYALLTEKRGDQAVQVMYSLFGQHQERERILGALSLASGVGLLLSTFLGGWLARRAVRPMSEALTLQRRFVADAGHELRTPLTLLSTRAQLLRRRLTGKPAPSNLTEAPILKDQMLHDIDGIVADTRTLTEILEELLLAADTRTPPPDQFVNLTGVAEAAVAAAQATASQRSSTLTFHPDASTAFTAGDPAALTRVVTALVDNALSHASTRVDVNVSRDKKSVSVQVRDDGPGIAEAAFPTMFNRFASDRPTGENGTGQRHYGLGLALVNEIVSRHGGTVTAVNQAPPSHGACLTVTLPTREPTPVGRLAPR
jgi:signal transduction histidine kinase